MCIQCLSRVALLSVMPLLGLMLTNTATGQTYSDNRDDIRCLGWAMQEPIHGIGDLGKVEKIIDCRGFVPLAAQSKAKKATAGMFGSCIQWYRFPTRSTLKELYHGAFYLYYYYPPLGWMTDAKKPYLDAAAVKKYNEATAYFDNVPIVKEDDAKQEDAAWCKAAYKIASELKSNEKRIENAEPVAILLTKESTFIIVSLRAEVDCQELGAFEFSRKLGNYKSCYSIYNNLSSCPINAETIKEYGPTVAKIIAAYQGR